MSNKHRGKINKIKKREDQEFSKQMNEHIRKDIASILQNVYESLKKDKINPAELEEMSNHTIHDMSIFQDKDSMNISIVLYSLYKLFSLNLLDDTQKNKIKNYIKNMMGAIINSNFKKYRMEMLKFIKYISTTNQKFGKYLQNVMEKAKIKKGSALYRHGISVGMISDIFGTSEWEMMNYIGKTKINDDIPISSLPTNPVSRFKMAKNFFNA